MTNQTLPTRALILAAAVVLLVATTTNAFSVPFTSIASPSSRAVTSAGSTVLLGSTKGDDDLPPREEREEEYSGNVDWDAEWKKVVEKERTGQKLERPGEGYYKSDAELAAIRAAKQAQTQVDKISSKLPTPPSLNMRSLTGDWRFWIGILAIISIGSAVLSAQPSYTPVSGGDSYYI